MADPNLVAGYDGDLDYVFTKVTPSLMKCGRLEYVKRATRPEHRLGAQLSAPCSTTEKKNQYGNRAQLGLSRRTIRQFVRAVEDVREN